MDETHAALPLSGEARAAGEARRFLRPLLLRWGLQDLLDDALLLATELVTNAVLHTRTAPAVHVVRLPGGALRLEVTDASPTLPRVHRYGPASTTGRGLRLLEALASDWGVDPVDGGKRVWCVLGGSGGRAGNGRGGG